jgi:hypothetical protein
MIMHLSIQAKDIDDDWSLDSIEIHEYLTMAVFRFYHSHSRQISRVAGRSNQPTTTILSMTRKQFYK